MFTQDPIALRDAEAIEAAGAAGAIGALSLGLEDGQSVELTADGELSVRVPAQALRLFSEVLSLLADGSGVVVLQNDAELTTQQAAEMLGVSRPFLVKLIEEGELPARVVGTHRRVLTADLLAYKKLDDVARRQARDELAARSQALGLDY